MKDPGKPVVVYRDSCYKLFINSSKVICKLDLVTLPSKYWFSSSIVLSISVCINLFGLVIIYLALYYYL